MFGILKRNLGNSVEKRPETFQLTQHARYTRMFGNGWCNTVGSCIEKLRVSISTVNIGTHRAARHDETAGRESGDRSKEGRGRDERWRWISERTLARGKRFDCTGVDTSPSSRTPSILVRMCPFPDCHLAFAWCHDVAYFRALHVQGSSTLFSSSPLLPRNALAS